MKMSNYEYWGQLHGTGHYFDKSDPAPFLDIMEERINHDDKWISYLTGFMDGLAGKYKDRFRWLTLPEPTDPPACLRSKSNKQP